MVNKNQTSKLIKALRKWDYPQSPCPVFNNGKPLVRLAADEITRLNLVIANLNKIRLGDGGTFIVDKDGFPTSELLQEEDF